MHGSRTLAQRCKDTFSHHAWHAGEDYSRGGRVEVVEVGVEWLIAHVNDRDGTQNEVELDWSSLMDGDDDLILADCTCDRASAGHLCRHIAGVIRSMDRDRNAPTIPGSFDLTVQLDTDVFFEQTTAPPSQGREKFSSTITVNPASEFLPSAPRAPASSQASAAAKAAMQRAQWRAALSAFAIAELPAAKLAREQRLAPEKHRLFYRINIESLRGASQLKIEFIKRTVKRNGTLGVSSAWNLTADDIAAMPAATDRELLTLLSRNMRPEDPYSYRYYYRAPASSSCELAEAVFAAVLPRLAATGRFGWVPGIDPRNEEPQILTWDDGPAWKFKLCLSSPGDKPGRDIVPTLYREGEEADIAKVLMVFPGVIMFPERIGLLDSSVTPQMIAAARRLGSIHLPAGQEDALVAEVLQNSHLPPIDLPDDLKWAQVRAEPQPRVQIGPVTIGSTTWLVGKLSYDYAGLIVAESDERLLIHDVKERRIVYRDAQREQAAMAELFKLGATPTSYAERYYGTFKVARKEFAPLVVGLSNAGWHVEAEGHRLRRPGTTHVSLASGVDWFELDGHIDYEGEQIGLPKLLEALRRGEDFVTLGDGSRGMLPDEWLARYAPLAAMGEADGDKLRFKPSQALLLDAWLSAQPEVDIDAAFQRVRERLRSFEGVQSHAEPAGFSGTLRPYQRDGLGWLLFLEEFGFGGCLADDMGLGKTIQVLAMILQRRRGSGHGNADGNGNGNGKSKTKGKGKGKAKGKSPRPTLVVVPRSLVRNWIEEARRFTPELKVLDYTGAARGDERERLDQWDIVVTTYGTLRRDAGHLKDLPFDYAILDEAQAIKNATSQAAKACRLIQADQRLAMTGTPVENHLGELWSIFDFLNPGMLGRSNSLKLISSKNSGTDIEGVQLLAKALRPFILRRTKEQVLDDLPEKTEQTLYCELDTQQRKLYDELRNHYRDALNQRIASEGMNKAKIHVLEALLRLRQAACHPGLLDKSKADEPSAKLETLLEQLDEVLNEGHKALVFSQFTSLLALVRRKLDKRKIVYEYLDGGTRDRQERVDRFQTDPKCPLFLISLKAGGLGLNLTAADYVFILDPWWNPAVEAQAVDRAHRIGQTRRVFAYRLIARDTVEEKILQLQGDKRRLADAIVSADNSVLSQLNAEDLQLLLS